MDVSTSVIFFVILGIATSANYFLASFVRDGALKIMGFVLVSTVGLSSAIQWYTYPPDRIVWRLLVDLLLIAVLLKNKSVFTQRPLLAVFSVSTYLSMAMVNLWTLLGKGESLVVFEIVSDVLFCALLLTCLWLGGRGTFAQLGNSNSHRNHNLRPHHNYHIGE